LKPLNYDSNFDETIKNLRDGEAIEPCVWKQKKMNREKRKLKKLNERILCVFRNIVQYDSTHKK